MRPLLRLFLFALLAVGLSLSSTAHAREAVNCADVPAASKSLAFDQARGEGQKQKKPDKACLGCLAGCHGHHVVTSAGAEPVPETLAPTPAPPIWSPGFRAAVEPDSALRPPQA